MLRPVCLIALACLTALGALSAGCKKVRQATDKTSPDAGLKRPRAPANHGELPDSPAEASVLIARHQKRKAGAGRPEPTADEVLSLLEAGIQTHRVATGWPMIVERLRIRLDLARRQGQAAYLLFGTWHDSGLQLDALRRLIGLGGIADWTALVVEQFDVDLAWEGAASEHPRGDGDDLAAWNERGDRAAFGRLRASQVRDNYTAYKYATLDRVMDLLVTARVAGVPVWGCDMPTAMQRRLQRAGLTDLTRLRELHCLRATEARVSLIGSRRRPARLAMLWGQDHVAPRGVPAFLEPDAEVIPVYAVGGRPVDHGLAAELGARLAITAPVLVPLPGGAGYLLLLPGERLRARTERRRVALAERHPDDHRGVLQVRTVRPVEVTVRMWQSQVQQEAEVRLAAGQVPFLVTSADGALAGGVEMPSGGFVELDLDPAARQVEVTAYDPEAPP